MDVRPPVELRWGTQAFSRDEIGESSLLLCCDTEHGIALKSLKGNWGSSRIEGGYLMVYLKLWQEAWCSSKVERKTSGNLSCCLRGVRPPFDLQGEPWDSSQVTAEE